VRGNTWSVEGDPQVQFHIRNMLIPILISCILGVDFNDQLNRTLTGTGKTSDMAKCSHLNMFCIEPSVLEPLRCVIFFSFRRRSPGSSNI